MVTLTPDLKQELDQQENLPFKLTQDNGVLIIEVAKNSPAAQAGLKAGDIIVSVGKNRVVTAADVQEQVEGSKIGNPLELEIKRQQTSQEIAVNPAPFPKQ
jgi:S1-C subfamily serine protease